MKWLIRYILLSTLLIMVAYNAVGQTAGQTAEQPLFVKDALTLKPIEGADCRLYWDRQRNGMVASTSQEGTLSIRFEKGHPATLTIEVAKEGYHPTRQTFPLTYIQKDTITIRLEPLANLLPNYTVVGQKLPYKEEGNPAVDLIRRVVQVEHQYRQKNLDDYTFRKIDRLTIALANFRLESSWLNRLFPFFHRYVTTSKIDGRWVLPLSQRDLISHLGYNSERKYFTEEIQYQATKGIDEKLDDGTMTVGYEELFPKIDLFQNSIRLLNNQFASPLSTQGYNHYRYYLVDTLVQEGYVVQKVQFESREPRAMTFQGELTITTEREPRLLSAMIQVPHVANLNFVDALTIRQYFDEVAEKPHIRLVKEEELNMAFKMYWNLLSLYVEQTRTYDQFDATNPNTLLINAKELVTVKKSTDKEKVTYANLLRNQELLASELGAEAFLEEMRQNDAYRLLLDLAEMVSLSYIRTRYERGKPHGGSYFDIGPILNTIGQNSTEGVRLRVGGRSTAFLSRNLFLEGYIAHGLSDRKWKYNLEATYSFNPKKYYRHEFPRHEVSLIKQFDLFTPGQMYSNSDKDNILFNIGTSYLTDRTYRDLWKLTYQNDFSADFSLQLYAHRFRDYPTGTLSYVQVLKDLSMVQIPYITDVAMGVELRWSPGDRIANGSIQRHSVYHGVRREVPVFRLKHETSLQSIGSDYSHNRTEISAEQRMWMGIYGRLDYHVTIGKIWDHVPFPMLYTPPTNSAFALNDHSFQLQRPLEFVADEWISIFTEYHLRGAIFNHIPYLNRLGLRGVLSLNYLYGNTSKRNRQATSPEVFVLPTISTEMINDHYLEAGIGLENILQIFRIDLYHRLTPLGAHSPSPWAVRGTIHFDF